MSIDGADADAALLALESEGVVLRGRFTGADDLEWCDRRLLARIHRYTLNRLRAEIEPITAADFQRFLFAWHGVSQPHHLAGIDGLRSVLSVLDGVELPASAWERAVLPARLERYDPAWLDMLCLTGEAAWSRLSVRSAVSGEKPALRVALFPREHGTAWHALRPDTIDGRTLAGGKQPADSRDAARPRPLVPERARQALPAARKRPRTRRSPSSRPRVWPSRTGSPASAPSSAPCGVSRARVRRADGAGRWSAVPQAASDAEREAAIEIQARVLLARYGVVFRRLLARETHAAPWRSLTAVYRRLEARGEIRGGRFVTGMSGEQFALPEAVERLRETRRNGRDGRLTTISAVDPLNLTGVLTTDDRVRAAASTRIVYRDGVALAVLEGDYMRPLAEIDPAAADGLASALAGRPLPVVTAGFLGR